MKASPVITIVTVCRNAGATIERTLQSVAKQTALTAQWEHIVVDGGSTDSTIDMIRRFPHVKRWISEADEGIADAFNKGMRMSRGEYVLYLNADDWLYDSNVISDAIAFIGAHERPDWIVGDVATDRQGQIVTDRKSFKPSCRSLILRNRIPHPVVLLRRDVLERACGFDKRFRFGMDFDLWIRLCQADVAVTYWPRTVSVFSSGGVSSRVSDQKDSEHEMNMHRIRNTFMKRLVGKLYSTYQTFRR